MLRGRSKNAKNNKKAKKTKKESESTIDFQVQQNLEHAGFTVIKSKDLQSGIKRYLVDPKVAYENLFSEWFSAVETLNYHERQEALIRFIQKKGALISNEDHEFASYAVFFVNQRLRELTKEYTFEATQKSILIIGDLIFKHFAYLPIQEKMPFIQIIAGELLRLSTSLHLEIETLDQAPSRKKWAQLYNYISMYFEIFSMYAALQRECLDLPSSSDPAKRSIEKRLLEMSPTLAEQIIQISSKFGTIFCKLGEGASAEQAFEIANTTLSWIHDKVLGVWSEQLQQQNYVGSLQSATNYLQQLETIIQPSNRRETISFRSAIIQLNMLWLQLQETYAVNIENGHDQSEQLSSMLNALSAESRDIPSLLQASIALAILLSEKVISFEERKLFLNLYLKWREILPDQGPGTTIQTRLLNELWGEVSIGIGKRYQHQNQSLTVKDSLSTSTSQSVFSPVSVEVVFKKWFEIAECINYEERYQKLFKFLRDNQYILQTTLSSNQSSTEVRDFLKNTAIDRLLKLSAQNTPTALQQWAGLFEAVILDYFNSPSIEFSFKACIIEKVLEGYKSFVNLFYEDMFALRDGAPSVLPWADIQPKVMFYEKHLIESMIAYRFQLVNWAFQESLVNENSESTFLRQRVKAHPEEYIKEAFLFGIQYALFLCVRNEKEPGAKTLYTYLRDYFEKFKENSLIAGLMEPDIRTRLTEMLEQQLKLLKSAVTSDRPEWFLGGIESVFGKSKFLGTFDIYRLLGVSNEDVKTFDDDLVTWESEALKAAGSHNPSENSLDTIQGLTNLLDTFHISSDQVQIIPTTKKSTSSLYCDEILEPEEIKSEPISFPKPEEAIKPKPPSRKAIYKQMQAETNRLAKKERLKRQQEEIAERKRRAEEEAQRIAEQQAKIQIEEIKPNVDQEEIIATPSLKSKARKPSRKKSNLDAARERKKLEEAKRLLREAVELEAAKQKAEQDALKKVPKPISISQSPRLKEGIQRSRPSSPPLAPLVNVWEEKRQRIEAERRRMEEEVEVERQRVEVEKRRMEEEEVERQRIALEAAEAEKARLEKELLEVTPEAIGVKALESLTSEFEGIRIGRSERAPSPFEIDRSFVVSDVNLIALMPPQVRSILWHINARGHRAYLTGGAVRDLLLGMPIRDVDLVAECAEAELQAILGYPVTKNPHIKEADVYRVGYYDIVLKPKNFSLKEDAEARDYEPNGFYADCNGRVFDALGHLQNLLSGVPIRLIGSNSIEKLVEDPIRILRGIDLQHKLQRPLAPEVQEAISSSATHLSHIPFGALKCHLNRMFLGGRAVQNFDSFEKFNLFPYLFTRFGSDFGSYWFKYRNLRNFMKSQCGLIDQHVMTPNSTPIDDLYVIALLMFPGVRKLIDQYDYTLETSIHVQLESFFRLKSGTALDLIQLSMRDCLYEISKNYQHYLQKKVNQHRSAAVSNLSSPQLMTTMYDQYRIAPVELHSEQSEQKSSTSNCLVNNTNTYTF